MAEIVAETDRLRLRDWDEEDEAMFYGIMNTPAVSSRVSPGKKKPTNMPDSAKMIAAIKRMPPLWTMSFTLGMTLRLVAFASIVQPNLL